jgi:hypothetical protein
MQANGAEMLRLACCFGTEAGIKICAPVHDALLIQAPLERLDQDIARMRTYMEEASKIVLSGFTVRTDVVIVKHPDRYMDERGAEFWETVMSLLNEEERQNGQPVGSPGASRTLQATLQQQVKIKYVKQDQPAALNIPESSTHLPDNL